MDSGRDSLIRNLGRSRASWLRANYLSQARDACAQQLQEFLPQLDLQTRPLLIELLGLLGGSTARDAVAALARDAEESIQDAATRELGRWRTPDVAPVLIDLARNDIGRIAKAGSVKVTESFVVERYSHDMHIVSNVQGTLKDGMSNMDVLKATFPAGTLSGAPKVHAMELIDQLEPVKRGIYGGACGYLSYAGDMDVAIAIRTAIVKNGTLYVQAAAGVVADSIPEMEWKETEHKARALLRAAELVEEGLE